VAQPQRPPDPSSGPAGERLFAPEGSAEGCASGECVPEPVVSAPDPEPDDEPAAARGATDHERWERAVDALRQASTRHGKALTYARFLGFTPDGVRVALPADAAFHRLQVTGMNRAMVEAELGKSLGRTIKLVEDASPEAFKAAQRSIAEVEATDRATRERLIDARVRQHPAVRAVLQHLGGAIEHVAILEPAVRERVSAPGDDAPPEE
jgi:hypothetical protein